MSSCLEGSNQTRVWQSRVPMHWSTLTPEMTGFPGACYIRFSSIWCSVLFLVFAWGTSILIISSTAGAYVTGGISCKDVPIEIADIWTATHKGFKGWRTIAIGPQKALALKQALCPPPQPGLDWRSVEAWGKRGTPAASDLMIRLVQRRHSGFHSHEHSRNKSQWGINPMLQGDTQPRQLLGAIPALHVVLKIVLSGWSFSIILWTVSGTCRIRWCRLILVGHWKWTRDLQRTWYA